MTAYNQGQDGVKANQAIGGFDIIHPDAAGIDVGADEMWVCVPPGSVYLSALLSLAFSG